MLGGLGTALGLGLPVPAARQGLCRVLVQAGDVGGRGEPSLGSRVQPVALQAFRHPLSTPVALVGSQRCPSLWGPLTRRSSAPCVTPAPTPRTVALLLYRGPQSHGDTWGKSFILFVVLSSQRLWSPMCSRHLHLRGIKQCTRGLQTELCNTGRNKQASKQET